MSEETATIDDQTSTEPNVATDAETQTETESTEGQEDSGTLLTGKDGEKEVAAPADWPEDWRDRLAGGDEKAMKKLGRYGSPADIFKAYRALEAKMSSGEVTAKLPEDATEEQIAEYRKANGIPDSPEGYLEKLPDGLVIGDDDKALVQSYLERVHGKNADPAVVTEALAWYHDLQEEQIAEQAKQDKEIRTKVEDELRSEWGNEYRGNINSIKAFLDSAPSDGDKPLGELLLGARLADGVPLGNHPSALRWLLSLANDANPAGFVAPNGGGNIESIEEEIKSIESKMGTDAYIKDEKMQARLRQLYDAQDRMAARG